VEIDRPPGPVPATLEEEPPPGPPPTELTDAVVPPWVPVTRPVGTPACRRRRIARAEDRYRNVEFRRLNSDVVVVLEGEEHRVAEAEIDCRS